MNKWEQADTASVHWLNPVLHKQPQHAISHCKCDNQIPPGNFQKESPKSTQNCTWKRRINYAKINGFGDQMLELDLLWIIYNFL